MTTAISLQRVGKRYTKFDDQPMLVNALRMRLKTRRSELWAVRDVDLEIAPAESVGILGRNGAGKSTLLQMLCGVTAPTTGRVAVRGRVAPLISVGVGFHPELTGRENVYVNGTVLGLSRREIDARFDQIVEFAELPGFIDTPVKFYSSGMFVRLGFSVAVAAAPDVLLVDEVLAVGDFSFQMRCFERMQQIRDEGTTIVVVSHNIGAVRGFCDRGVLMQRGAKTFDGPVNAAISAYYESVGSSPESGEPAGSTAGQPRAVVESFELLDAAGRTTLHVESGTTLMLRVTVRATDDLSRPFLGVVVTSESGVPVYSDTNLVNPFPDLPAGSSATYVVGLDAALAGGSFTVTGGVHHHVGADRERVASYGPLSFYVAGRGLVHGVADLNGRFEELT